MDILTGADAGALSNLVHKWSVNCPTQVSSPIPGQHDILHFIDKGQCECLNEVSYLILIFIIEFSIPYK